MWTRQELKARAKHVLSSIYLNAFFVSLVIALAGGSNGGSSSGGGSSSQYTHIDPFHNWYYYITPVLIFGSFFLVYRIFLGYALEVGGRRYFIQSAQYLDNQKCIRFAFRSDIYTGIIGTMLYRGILIFLWSLLLIIPGIIKAYAYSMVPYILADDPNVRYQDAIRLSNDMTYGHKMEMFILDLSFIGWYLLGALALGVGVLFVMPYENATKAELYLVLRRGFTK